MKLPLQQITDLFFDLDHTIYDFDKNSALTFTAAFKQFNLEKVEDFMTHFKPINDAYWERFSKDEITRDALRYGRLKDTFEAINLNVTDDKIYAIADYFIDNLSNHNHVFDGAHEALDYLKTKYRLHIITNGPDVVQYRKLQNAQLAHYFESVTNSEIAGVKKPHPQIFNHALNKVNVTAQQSIMIGDNYQADIMGALNVGMHVIWFNCNQEQQNIKNEIFQINQLKQLINFL